MEHHLGAGGRFPAALKTDEHDDVVLSFGGGPGLHAWVNQLEQRSHVNETHSWTGP